MDKRVYYISGFDPRGASFYHRLFREESRKSGKLTGLSVSTSKRANLNDTVSHWQVEAQGADIHTHIDYRFLVWDNVIRKFWISATPALLWTALPLYISHFKCRLFAKFRKAGRGPYICSLYPFWFASAALLIAIAIGIAVFFTSKALYPALILNFLLALTAPIAAIAWAHKLGERIGAWWILQTYVFIARWGQQPMPLLDQKIDDFANTIIADHLNNPEKEVLIVGHCVGSILSVALMARLINKAPATLADKLMLVTMGQCIPYLSYIPTAHHFRQDLSVLAHDTRFHWLDFGARADPLCFDEVNPAVADGITPTDTNRPVRHVVRPYRMFTEERYRELKKDKLKLHFQYLRASELANSYDFFEMIALPNAVLKHKTFE